ncbi:hypothetical protein [Comamonas odontotermitis]|uniref:hypothetical protein n=1 Tax=Comamonas odontotermitis TaxID=379895 RepID=UPI001CC3D383|nr:hypothetical protein [Comamonas odontotermitis]UBB17773.1 hypothetical protein LAD35_03765 [Comamonas odontotermitis]
MSFTDKTIFNIRERNAIPKEDVDSRNVSDDDYIFHQPFRTVAEPTQDLPKSIYHTKIVRLLQQAAANKATS